MKIKIDTLQDVETLLACYSGLKLLERDGGTFKGLCAFVYRRYKGDEFEARFEDPCYLLGEYVTDALEEDFDKYFN